ncbi:hypothetical protein [Amycolatopsis decaplanina]|uniref:Uncharacterized protein n=1 Tax=Amycolatopsis decaplanina DSM 44594 TaxID=1284240 RepID=M2ZL24_9PSEU|nr:hypothetical protein [Amycolatopsis decaplanina]EME61583.1 hypothetical protein H074_10440 [Amycolatopsis decaplanina DSM 44594]
MGNERPRYWFPLALLGFAQLAVVALSFGGMWSGGWFAYAPATGEQQFLTQNLYGVGSGGVFGSFRGVEMSRETAAALDMSFSGLGRNDGWLFAVLAVYLGTVLFHALRSKAMRWWKVVAIALGGLVAIVLADLVGYWELDLDGDTRSAILLTLGLVALAWLERSVLVLVVAAAYVLCAVVLAQGQLALVLSSLVVLAGAFAALLSRPKAAAEET